MSNREIREEFYDDAEYKILNAPRIKNVSVHIPKMEKKSISK